MQWGLSKAVLKDIWDAVAGDEGRLSQGQFLSCLYLMDLAKRNIAPPKTLPPGPFPPIAAPTAAEASGSAAFSLSSVQQVMLTATLMPAIIDNHQKYLAHVKCLFLGMYIHRKQG